MKEAEIVLALFEKIFTESNDTGQDQPYRDWFHEDEESFVAAMRLRVALGKEIPEDVADLEAVWAEPWDPWDPELVHDGLLLVEDGVPHMPVHG